MFLQESLWERKVTEIIQDDPAFQAVSHESAAVLRAWFRDPPYHVIYKVRSQVFSVSSCPKLRNNGNMNAELLSFQSHA